MNPRRREILFRGTPDFIGLLPEKIQGWSSEDQMKWLQLHGIEVIRRVSGGMGSDTMSQQGSLAAKNTWTTDQYFKTRPWIDILAYPGVDPTGAADSTTGINQALADVPAAGATVFIPWGLYKITAPLVMKAYTRFKGMGGHDYDVSRIGTTTIQTSGAVVRGIDARFITGFVLEDFQIDGNNLTGGTTALIDIDGVTTSTPTPMSKIIGVRVSMGQNRGIYAAATNATFVCHIDKCVIGYNQGAGIRADANSLNDSYITNSYIAANGTTTTPAPGIDLGGYAANVDITGNHIEFNHGDGVLISGEDIRIGGGLIDRNDGPGVRYSGALRCYLGSGCWTRRNGVTQGVNADSNANVYILAGSDDINIGDCQNSYDYNDAGTVPEVPYNGISVTNSHNIRIHDILGTGGTFRFINDAGGNTCLTYWGVNNPVMSEGPNTGIATLSGHLSIQKLATPAAPTVVPTLGSGTTYTYEIVAFNGQGDSLPSSTTSTAVGPTTLDGTHFNTIDWTPITGAQGYKIIRTVGGGAGGQGVLPSHGASLNTTQTYSAGTNTHYVDPHPVTNGTATAVAATTLTDSVKTWATNLYTGMLLTMGASTATITSNTAQVLTFSGGWTGGTPSLGPYIVAGKATAYTAATFSPGGGLRVDSDIRLAKQSPAFAASPAPDANLGGIYEMAALTGAVTVANPVNAAQGQRIRFYWRQDGTGGRTVTYSGTNFRSVGIAAQTTTLNTYTIDEAECLDGTIWRVIRLVTGQTV